MITNRNRAARTSDFVITPMSTDRIRLHAVLLPLMITTVLLLLFVCLFSLVVWLVLFLAVKTQRVNQILIMPASTTHGKKLRY